MSRILIVDDEEGVCFAFEKFLKAKILLGMAKT